MTFLERSDKLTNYKITLSDIIRKCDDGIKINQDDVEARKIISESLLRVRDDYQKQLDIVQKNQTAIQNFNDDNWNIFLNNSSTDSRFDTYLELITHNLKETTVPITDIAASAPTFTDTSGNSVSSLLTMINPQFSIVDSATFLDHVDFIRQSLQTLNPPQISEFDDFIKEWVIKKEAFQKKYLLLKLRTIIFDKIISYTSGQDGFRIKRLDDKILYFIIGYQNKKDLSAIVLQRINEIIQQLVNKQNLLSRLGKDRENVTDSQVNTLMEETVSLITSALKLRDSYFIPKQ